MSFRLPPTIHRVLFFIAVTLVLPGAGCLRFSSSSTSGVVFETVDGGERWTTIQQVLEPVEARPLANQKATMFAMSPHDVEAVYLSVADQGLYTLWSGAWLPLRTKKNPKAFAIDTQRPCTLYASFEEGVEKSQDCGRRWERIFENAPNTLITAIAVSPSDASQIVMGSNRGDLFVSTTYGKDWRSPLRTPSPIDTILFHPKHAEEIYVFTKNNGLYRSSDNGTNWLDLSTSLSEMGDVFRQAVIDPTRDTAVYVATKQRLLRSIDRGEHWEAIPLLTSPEVTDIQTIAIDQQDSRGIYYATTTTIYRSQDGGQLWQALSLPSKRSPLRLLSDPTRHGHLLLSVQ